MSSAEPNIGDTVAAEDNQSGLKSEQKTAIEGNNCFNNEMKNEVAKANNEAKDEAEINNEPKETETNGSDNFVKIQQNEAKSDVEVQSTDQPQKQKTPEHDNNKTEMIYATGNGEAKANDKQDEPKSEAEKYELSNSTVEETQIKPEDLGKKEEEKKETEADQKKEVVLEESTSTEKDQKAEQQKVTPGGLPKWMVHSADSPLPPSPEATGPKEEQPQESPPVAPQKGGGRRGRRPGQKIAKAAAPAAGGSVGESSSQAKEPDEPRRSTRRRTQIDYANPDPVTVLADVDDEEPSGGGKRLAKGPRGRKPGSPAKGRKAKTETSEDDVREYDEDDEDYGSSPSKKKKRASIAGKSARLASHSAGKRGRGRPSAKGGLKAKGQQAAAGASGGRRKRGRKHDESDDDEGEVVYDDRVSEKEQTSEDEFDEGKVPVTPSKAKPKPSAAQIKPPAKKRGRPPGRGGAKKVAKVQNVSGTEPEELSGEEGTGAAGQVDQMEQANA